MQIQRSYAGFTIFITSFSKEKDLITKFRHTELIKSHSNRPVDFAEVGLLRCEEYDKWLPDTILSVSTDEVAPCVVNGDYIGANHGAPCAVKIFSAGHNRRYSDIGTVWKDDDGTEFTLLRIDDSDYITLVSENLGKDECNYSFKRSASGNLVRDGSVITVTSQRSVYLSNALRIKQRCVFGVKNGVRTNVDSHCVCDYAEIIDNYEIINPATVAIDLVLNRPTTGYYENPDLSLFGKAMIEHNMTYVILNDGTVLLDFNIKRKMNVHFQRWLGIMHQEKRNPFGGGVYRYIPKTKAFSVPEGNFDYSFPTALSDNYPQSFYLEKDLWADEQSPPDRCIDYFRDIDGQDVVCFATGFLPVYDGAPSVRKDKISNALYFYKSKKYYPTFADGDIKETRGVGYKKYFVPQCDGASVYDVKYKDMRFIFADFFRTNEIRIAVDGELELFESYGDLEYSVDNETLYIKGSSGSIIFIEHN